MANVIQITPFMHVRDLEAAIAFMEGVLGFRTLHREPGYAYLDLDGAGIRILEAQGAPVAARGERRFTYYVDVRDVDSLHAELKPKLDSLPAGDVHGPADKPYGQRELIVVAPDGQLFVFGAAIRKA